MVGAGVSLVGKPNTMIMVVAMNVTKPYMVKRCETRRFWLQNSPEVNTSCAMVLIKMAFFSPPPSSRSREALAFSALSKKYVALFLWIISMIVPPTTKMNIRTT